MTTNAKPTTGKTEQKKIFGLTEEELQKSMDILPTLDLGKMPIGTKLFLKFAEKEPREIELKEKGKYGQSSAWVINIDDFTLGENTVLKYTMFLSAKTLRLAVIKLWKNNDENLENIKIQLIVGSAEFKEFGENRCYTVQQIISNSDNSE